MGTTSLKNQRPLSLIVNKLEFATAGLYYYMPLLYFFKYILMKLDIGRSTPECLTELFAVNNN